MNYESKLSMEPSPYHQIICWVYITTHAHDPGRRIIGFTRNIDEEILSAPDPPPILYCRRFDNLMDALAHKLMLEQLSASTIDILLEQTIIQTK